jgi:D-glycero-alpha-D-manno-heptose-7-phosphate kinase
MIITQTPLRVSFLGGGTDYPEHFEVHGGAVLGTAVGQSCYFTAAPFQSRMFDYRLRVAYRKVECVARVEDIEHRPFRECLRWTGLTRDIEITLTAELPAMTGLGSSSAFTVGLLNTIYAHQKRLLPPLELAYRAVEFERGVLRESVGCQDQTLAALGGFNLIEFRALGDFRVHRLALPPERLHELESHLLCFYTGIRRRADDLARAQTRRVGLNRDRLLQMRALVDDGHRVLTGRGSLAPFGELLHQSWALKRDLDGRVSSPRIDRWYRAAIDAGAIGGKLLGAGGGGFLLLFAPPETHDFIRARLADLVEVNFGLDAPGSRVIFDNTNAGSWRVGGVSPLVGERTEDRRQKTEKHDTSPVCPLDKEVA